MSNKNSNSVEEIKELLREASDKIYEASESLKQASKMMADFSYGYNIKGNMEAYVINYLTDGCDSITEKIEKYIEETDNLDGIEFDEDEDEDEK